MEQQHRPFENEYDFFANIPKDERAKYYETVFAAKQNPIPPQKVFIMEYPSTATFRFEDYQLNYYQLENSDEPNAIFIHFHGFRSHGGVTGYFANIIAKQNPKTNVYAMDQLNFGRSEGPCRGLIESLDHSVRQGEAFVQYLLSKFRNRPKVFMSGSSLGGTIIFKMAIKKPSIYDGLVFLSPGLRDIQQSQYYAKMLGKFIGWMAPRMCLPSKISSREITKNNCDQYLQKDPYFEKSLVTGSITAALNAMAEVSKLYGALETPYLMLMSGMDKSVDLFAGVDLHIKSPSKDKETVYFRNMWHSVFYEEEIQDIAQRVGEWVRKRI